MGTKRDKLERSLGGIADMKKVPDMIFIIDTNVEALAVKEAIKLNIPIVAIVDTNSDPTGINFPIPGNDDARRSINLYCELVKETVLDAQKQITQDSKEESEPEIKLEESKIKVKELVLKPKAKIDVIKKKSKSIISKIQKLASRKKK